MLQMFDLLNIRLLGVLPSVISHIQLVKWADQHFFKTCFVSFQEELQPALKSLQEKLEVFNEVKQTCDQTAEHIKVNMLST